MISSSRLFLWAVLSFLWAPSHPCWSWNLQRGWRAGFLPKGAAATAVVLTGGTAPAGAKDADPALKGTKKDPAYETCISQCMYECTKPKGNEQMSRTQCLPGCKKQCATTKAQLMVGTPLLDTTNAKK